MHQTTLTHEIPGTIAAKPVFFKNSDGSYTVEVMFPANLGKPTLDFEHITDMPLLGANGRTLNFRISSETAKQLITQYETASIGTEQTISDFLSIQFTRINKKLEQINKKLLNDIDNVIIREMLIVLLSILYGLLRHPQVYFANEVHSFPTGNISIGEQREYRDKSVTGMNLNYSHIIAHIYSKLKLVENYRTGVSSPELISNLDRGISSLIILVDRVVTDGIQQSSQNLQQLQLYGLSEIPAGVNQALSRN